MIAQTKRENQVQRTGIGDKVDEKIEASKADIAQEKAEIQAKGEAVKQKVKERGNKGVIKTSWNEAGNAISGDDDE